MELLAVVGPGQMQILERYFEDEFKGLMVEAERSDGRLCQQPTLRDEKDLYQVTGSEFKDAEGTVVQGPL